MIKEFFNILLGERKEIKCFDFVRAEEYFEKYKNDLVLGELLLLGNESISEIYIENGRYVKSIDFRYNTVAGVKGSDVWTPCMHFKYFNGNEEYIPCYFVVSENQRTGGREFKGNCRIKVLTKEEIEELRMG